MKALDGEEALQKVREQAPDVILLDVMMPKMDGYEVSRRLKDDPATAIIPIIMVTALGETQDRIRALEAGADDFLAKPVDKTELTARVRSSVKIKKYNDYMLDHQKELEKEVAERTKDLQRAFDDIKSSSLETILRLSRAAEYKDENTGTHIKRMSQYTAIVAKRWGCPQARWSPFSMPAPCTTSVK